MAELNFRKMRVAFQGEPGAFSEAAAVQLLGDGIRTVPRTTFDSAFGAIAEGAADGLLVPVENTLAGSGGRVYGLLLGRKVGKCGGRRLPAGGRLRRRAGAEGGGLRAG